MNTTTASPTRTTPNTRSILDFPEVATKAVELLSSGKSAFSLLQNEASYIVSLMRLVQYPAGGVVFNAGDETNTGYMLLVVEGDVSVDTGNVGGGTKVEISILGPGTLLGELALIDGSPRSANCKAVTAVTAAGLSAGGLQRLAETHPQVAFKLAVHIARNAADRLRGLSEQLQMYDHLVATMQQDIDKLRVSAGK